MKRMSSSRPLLLFNIGQLVTMQSADGRGPRRGEALNEMLASGTTTVEAKSGYGLLVESELKSLDAIRTAALQWPGTVVATLLGAHAVPLEYEGKPREYLDLVCKRMIPQAAKRKL